VFRQAGDIKRIIMGLDRLKKTPCGFCFVEYFDREDSETALRFLNGAKLDDRQIRTDWDWGFEDGRQYGRGKSGGQVSEVRFLTLIVVATLTITSYSIFNPTLADKGRL